MRIYKFGLSPNERVERQDDVDPSHVDPLANVESESVLYDVVRARFVVGRAEGTLLKPVIVAISASLQYAGCVEDI